MSIRVPPQSVLRLGLSLTFFYAGYHAYFDPGSWVDFIPQFISAFTTLETAVRVVAICEIVIALLVLTGFLLPIASFLGSMILLSTLIFYGIDDITFRDFGLLMASAALFLFSAQAKRETRVIREPLFRFFKD